MYCKGKKIIPSVLAAGCLLAGLLLPSMTARAEYIGTNRDTAMPEPPMRITEQSTDGYEKLYETGQAVYYFRDDRDIIAVYDKENGYLWKTGLDTTAAKKLKTEALKARTDEAKEKLKELYAEDNLNEIYSDMANSLITVEYRLPDAIETLKKASSSSSKSASKLSREADDQYCLDIDFQEIDLQMKVHITFGERSIRYAIRMEEMTGEGLASLTSVYITPFLGSSGGRILGYNEETGAFDVPKKKDAPTGYAFVPDGSGGLVRFRDNSTAFKEYVGDIYGEDIAQLEYSYMAVHDAIAVKNPVMPVFGVAYGSEQAAFVAYADEGDEYMNVLCTPEENVTNYTWTCARFNYNVKYHQIYNKAGDGYFAMMSEPNRFDIDMTYEFLAGDGSGNTESADYVGMALTYRKHLEEQGILKEKKAVQEQIPIRLDFIMSDAKNSVVGTENVVMTTAEQAGEILGDIRQGGITNISTGLYGWQKRGRTLSKPYTRNFSSRIGTAREFEKLIVSAAEVGTDISLAQDYITINKDMLSYYNTAVRHVNSWYVYLNKRPVLPETAPVSDFGFAKPQKSAAWLSKQYEGQKEFASSMTVEGIGRILSGDYSGGTPYSVSEAIAIYQETLSGMGGVKLAVDNPGMYLWEYTDRYLQAPVGHSQYVFETDAVPFLQLVLNGTMEVYAPYSNFSFYTQQDILKMIDYNLSPSFILSKEPSYKLADTDSADLYSTEYTLYEELIQNIYSQVNRVLSQVSGYRWTDRTVVQDGVIVNSYELDGKVRDIVINYTEDTVEYGKVSVEAMSALAVD